MALIEAAERERKLENRKTENQKRERKREMGAQRKGQREEGEEEEEGEIQSWCSCHGNRHHLGEEQNRTALGKDPVCERIYTHTRTHKTHQTITFSFMFHQHCPIFGCGVLVEYENFFGDQQSVQRSSNDAPLAMDV